MVDNALEALLPTNCEYSQTLQHAVMLKLLVSQVVEAMHAKGDDSNIPLKPLEAMLSIDLAHPNIIHTYKFYTRIREVCCKQF